MIRNSADAFRDVPERASGICAIEMQFSAGEAAMLLRALAVAKQKTIDSDRVDDLELLRQRIYLRACGYQRIAGAPVGPQPKPPARVYSTAGRIRVWDEETGHAA